jgi:predicted phage terminase large subunit-like protein
MQEMTSDEVKRLKVAHVLCLSDFTYFTRYFFKAQYKRKWQQWDHLIIIANALKDVVEGKTTRLIINVFPRGGKTELAIKDFIPYCLALNPSAKFIHLSYSDDLALDNSEAARDMVQSDEYQKMFPRVRVKKSSDSKKKWYTDQNGGVYATSTGGQITGFGAGTVEDEEISTEVLELERLSGESWLGEKRNFGGAILIDDPNKVDDADSELLRNRVNERFDSTISNRVNSRKTPIVILQQRTHENDLSGYLIKKQGTIENGGAWRVICLPSIKEDGTALCPEKFTIEELRALEAHNDIVFQRQHMQNPKPRAGLLFPDPMLFNYEAMEDKLNECDYSLVAIDPSGTQGGGDDFAVSLAKLIGNKIYITDVIYNNKGTDHNEMAVHSLITKENPKTVLCESVFGFKETSARIRTALWDAGWKNEYRNLHPRTNKHTRIVNRSSFINNNFYFRDDWEDRPEYAKFFRNLTSYTRIQEGTTKAKTDDAPDNLEQVGQYYERNFPSLWAIK